MLNALFELKNFSVGSVEEKKNSENIDLAFDFWGNSVMTLVIALFFPSQIHGVGNCQRFSSFALY